MCVRASRGAARAHAPFVSIPTRYAERLAAAAETFSRWADAATGDAERFRKYFHRMLDAGIYLAPSPYEAAFVSSAHTNDQIDATIAAAKDALK